MFLSKFDLLGLQKTKIYPHLVEFANSIDVFKDHCKRFYLSDGRLIKCKFKTVKVK